MNQLSEICRPIEGDLQAYRQLFEQTLQQENPLLKLAINHLLQRPGKLVRPILVLLSARYVGKVNEAVFHTAVALELLHTASLVHDDVVDHSDRRRGQKSVNALLNNHIAVLVGDFLLSKALYHAAATGSTQVVTWVSELGQTLSDGELLQIANTDKKTISEEDYYEVIRKKTAALFITCAKAGAFLAGGSDEEVKGLETFGEAVGTCFQLRDDIFDYDQQNNTGKPTGNDMKEGKLTLPVIHALLASKDEQMFALAMRVRQGEASETEIQQLVDFALTQGGIAYTREAMANYSQRALDALPNAESRDPAIAESLASYVDFVVGREK